MRKNISLLAVCTWLVSLCASAYAQQSKVPRLGLLGVRPAASPGLELLQQELRELGYVDGKNIAFEFRSAGDKFESFPALARELVALKVDVLITPGTPASLAAKNATKTIPIVFTGVADPVPTGLIDSLARPGGNITGFTEISEVLAGKRMEVLKETLPRLARLAVLWNPRNPGNAQQWQESQRAAKGLGLELYSIEASSADKYQSAFREAVKSQSTAVAIAQDSVAQTNLKLIADLALKNRLPAIYPRADFVTNGGLMSYGPSPTETYKRVSAMIDKILKGTKPANIPVEQPTKFELIINLKTAKQIGLTIPPNVLARADKVIR